MAATPVTATYGGDCGRAYVRLWENSNLTGKNVKYCWYGVGGGDAQMVSYDTVPNLGPLYNGSYAFDFHTSDAASGISGAVFYNNPGDGLVSNLCIYTRINFVSPYARLYSGGNYGGLPDVASIKWTQVGSINDC